METRCLKTTNSWRNGLIIHTLSRVFKIQSPDKSLKKKKIASAAQKATRPALAQTHPAHPCPGVTGTLSLKLPMVPMAPSEDKQQCNGKPVPDAATEAEATTRTATAPATQVPTPMPAARAATPAVATTTSTTAANPAAPPAPNPAPARRTPMDYIFGKVIGEGSFSTVYVAKDIHTHKQYAIKVCEKKHIIREKKTEHMKREKEALNILSNAGVPFFVKLYCTFQDTDRLYFVLSYAKFGELLPYINRVGSFDLACTRFYAGEILVALEHLKRLKIIHRDLKPENVLLDENMHILIADFGSAKLNYNVNTARTTTRTSVNREDQDSGSERARRNSFVGTAQYVSPELLTDKTATHSSDLWALGCIIYQMIAGLPPFRSRSEYIIFQKILKLEYEFPQGFCSSARDLVEKLLVIESTKRLGATDSNNYTSVRSHPFFDGVDFDNLHLATPPPIYPYLPGVSEEEDLRSNYKVPDSLEPGLNDKQLTRLLGLELQPSKPLRKKSSILDISKEEMEARLAKQQESMWNQFVEGHLILKEGLVDKRKGLFAKRRMLLLTTGPHLYYVDPVNMVLKGEIPWSSQLRVEPKSFKIFFVHTPNRTYYLEDPQGYALEWCKVIEEVRVNTYNNLPT
nr:PREDICTED: 3-phosphoinositide-dependent protein kinase 1 isoform X2 [Bemisia tabaci]